jgi:CRISPR-associated endonuclease Csn1
MKKILGLDLGTNSIGWSLIEVNYKNKVEGYLGDGKIIGIGSRIIPMSEAILSDFGKGNTVSQTADRTSHRGVRRLRQRHLLRRERLHRVLNILDFLPVHYADAIDFEKRLGQFFENEEPKLAYVKNAEGKPEFLFQDSFNEMVEDFRKTQPSLFYKKENGEETKIPYDWTIYYLRKKALSKKISKGELAWLILHFNQKRGYYQLRGDEMDSANDASKKVEFIEVLVADVIDIGETHGKDLKKYEIHLENGLSFIKPSKKEVEWKGKLREFIITTELNEDGSEKLNKYGDVKRSFKSVDSEKDWIAIKSKSEKTINESGKTVGAFIYDTLLQKPNQKIRGKLVRTIERGFYRDEFQEILSQQIKLQPELFKSATYEACVKHLYPLNIPHQTDLLKKDFTHFFLNDIVFYQRPLKSKKSLIAECKYEYREFTHKESGEKKKQGLKCIAKSHPIYQEFRLWEWVQNLKIYERESRQDGVLKTDVEVTGEFISSIEEKVKLFEWLNDRKVIKQNSLLGYFKKEGKKLNDKNYRWNFVEDKEYPCNETRAGFITALKKDKGFDCQAFLTPENELELWHTLYSIADKKELESALQKLASRLGVEYELMKSFNDFPPYKKDYGAFSFKALNKLLPLLRVGIYWSEQRIPEKLKERIGKILNGEVDDSIDNKTRERLQNFSTIQDFQGLPLWLASYVVYGRHSEASDKIVWKHPDDIERLKQHSLRNPIVEQVINETLQVVKDIWSQYGKGEEKFFDEIHVELGREMKSPKKDRERITKLNTENQNTNLRIRAILKEMMNDPSVGGDVKDYSPSQQDLFKIYEQGVLTTISKLPEDIEKISKKADPTQKEIQKYRIWLEQGYRSPYTGEMIPLSKLFTTSYQIEHVLPQSRYFDDSMNNKIICEAEVNSLKSNQTGYEFIDNHKSQIIDCSGGKTVKIFSKEEYERFVSENFRGKKKDIMLMPDIPEAFTERQLNDSRYISKVVLKLMSNLVREEDEESVNSKNVIPVNGKVTSRLRREWGLNDKWNELIAPRFQRMNELTNSTDFGCWEEKGGNKFFRNMVPEELKKNFDPKRIDHGHHALDALVIALADRRHVNYLNNQSAAASQKDERMDLRRNLRNIESKQITDKAGNIRTIQVAKGFLQPWKGIVQQVKERLNTTVVSVKQNKRVINKNVNQIEKWKVGEDGELKKKLVKQAKNGEWWSVRRPLHQETVHGEVRLRDKKEVSVKEAIVDWRNIVDKEFRNWVKSAIESGKSTDDIIKQLKKEPYEIDGKIVKKVQVRYLKEGFSATRKPLDSSFNEKTIYNITDTGIRKILFNHLKQEKHKVVNSKGDISFDSELAFSPEGIEELNKNIKVLNEGKNHKPIYKVRKFEAMGKKFPVGEKGNKATKFVVAASGTNLFFAIYEGENDKGELVRQFITIPLNEVIPQLKDGLEPVPKKYHDKKGNEYELLFSLSPNDIVYLPSEEEQQNSSSVDFNKLSKTQIERLFRMEKTSGSECYFMFNNIASLVQQYDAKSGVGEFGSQNKFEKVGDDIRIKDYCWKLKIDRLGNLRRIR